ncbi:holo-ACP synthase [Mycoplasmopsis edwardii]|uniref:4'-phosphopantetheinyl transferase superfamily protein n=1 Tax=Mycoplasmopsis edwardii TaxID=53558 RepID=A0ACD4PI41_9BACT|nr:4'-phosphopantetheinyl transferase superfamily protein [Mycoplasmopsis edwardii]WBP83800.1 4'-phosphopantetheinyl transferase superfamily protein [Mycoplasmopsis edwardii]
MLSNGVDLTTISRFKNKTSKFAQRILSPSELIKYEQINNNDQKALFLARAWAIKEAIFKCDNQFFDFTKIELIKKDERWTFLDFKISISHENDLLIAFVIREQNNKGE